MRLSPKWTDANACLRKCHQIGRRAAATAACAYRIQHAFGTRCQKAYFDPICTSGYCRVSGRTAPATSKTFRLLAAAEKACGR